MYAMYRWHIALNKCLDLHLNAICQMAKLPIIRMSAMVLLVAWEGCSTDLCGGNCNASMLHIAPPPVPVVITLHKLPTQCAFLAAPMWKVRAHAAMYPMCREESPIPLPDKLRVLLLAAMLVGCFLEHTMFWCTKIALFLGRGAQILFVTATSTKTRKCSTAGRLHLTNVCLDASDVCIISQQRQVASNSFETGARPCVGRQSN